MSGPFAPSRTTRTTHRRVNPKPYAEAVINKRLPELGTTGRHTRTAVGTAELSFDITAETEMTASVRD